jgi:hypothetical protein
MANCHERKTSMKTLALAAALAAALAGNARAGDGLRYLSAYDTHAIDLFQCGELVGVMRDNFREAGFGVYGGLAETLLLAGKASVVKSALVAAETSHKPKIANVSFTSSKTRGLVDGDVEAHIRKAHDDLFTGSFSSGVGKIAACLAPTYRAQAEGLVNWWKTDTSVLAPKG